MNPFENPDFLKEVQRQTPEVADNGGFGVGDTVDFTTPSGEKKGWQVVRFKDHEERGRLATVRQEGKDDLGIPVGNLRRAARPEGAGKVADISTPKPRLAGKEIKPPHKYLKAKGFLKPNKE